MCRPTLGKQNESLTTAKGIHGNTSKAEIKCVCLNARSIINKKNELNIMVDDIKPHIIGTRQVTRATHVRNRVCPRVELILKIIIILLIIFLGFIKSKPC